jgi:putative hemolysin
MAETSTGLEVKDKYIDIKKVLTSKSPKLAKWLPGFVFGYVKRLIREDDLNAAMDKIGDYMGLDFVDGALNYLDITVKAVGLENIPREGGVILAANHPLGGIDGMAFMQVVGRARKDFQFLVNDMLLNIKNLESLFVPVNKVGSNPREASKLIEEAYSKDIAVMIFPAGLVSRKQPQGIEDLIWKKSFIVRARKYKKDIVPIHIEGQNSIRFYNIARFREKIGIKGNFEMALLPDEMFKQRGKTITIRIGKPIPYQHFDHTKTPTEWAAEVRELTYDLPNRM